MSSGRTLALALASLLALPTLTFAQQGHHAQGQAKRQTGHEMMGMGQEGSGMMGSGMMGMMGMMAGPTPAMILNQEETLKLEPAQVERLEKLRGEMVTLHQSHMAEMNPLMEQARQAMRADNVDLSAYKSTLEKLATHRIDMMMQAAQISQNALAVLNAQQRSEVGSAMRMMGGMMHGAGMGAGDCSMMQQMRGQGGQGG